MIEASQLVKTSMHALATFFLTKLGRPQNSQGHKIPLRWYCYCYAQRISNQTIMHTHNYSTQNIYMVFQEKKETRPDTSTGTIDSAYCGGPGGLQYHSTLWGLQYHSTLCLTLTFLITYSLTLYALLFGKEIQSKRLQIYKINLWRKPPFWIIFLFD